MLKINIPDIYPFTIAQLQHYYKELQEAGTFDHLMKQKEALVNVGGTWVIALCDRETYKKTYLTGIYEPLREYYKTDNPFTFWAEMNNMMKKTKKLI